MGLKRGRQGGQAYTTGQKMGLKRKYQAYTAGHRWFNYHSRGSLVPDLVAFVAFEIKYCNRLERLRQMITWYKYRQNTSAVVHN